jgi:hypothetical protein
VWLFILLDIEALRYADCIVRSFPVVCPSGDRLSSFLQPLELAAWPVPKTETSPVLIPSLIFDFWES